MLLRFRFFSLILRIGEIWGEKRRRYFIQYIRHYQSPFGGILLAADEIGLTGLWFEGQKYFALYLDKEHEERELPVFETASF